GGLFRRDPALDDLDLDDAPWANAFTGFGAWDFRDEVNVDVLGHLFERSITELEKLRVGGLFALTGGAAGEPPNGAPAPAMPRSAERKRFGIYYTPPAFTGLLVERTVDALARERFEDIAKALAVDPDTGREKAGNPSPEYLKRGIDALRDLKIVDPACGSGAFLIRAYDALETHYQWAVDGLIAARGVSAADL